MAEEDLILRLLLKIGDADVSKAVENLESLRQKAQQTQAAVAAVGQPGRAPNMGIQSSPGFVPQAYSGPSLYSPSGALLPTPGVSYQAPYITREQMVGPPQVWLDRRYLGPGQNGPSVLYQSNAYNQPTMPGFGSVTNSVGAGMAGQWPTPYGVGVFGASPPGGSSGWDSRALAGANVRPSSWNGNALGAAGAAQLDSNKWDSLGLQKYDTDLTKLARSMTMVHTGALNLAAGVALLNKSFEEGSGFDNWYTKAIAITNLASGGGQLLRGVGGATRQAAAYGSNFLGNAAIGAGGGLASRGLAAGAGWLGGVANAGVGGTLAAGWTAGGAALGVGAVGLGIGTLGVGVLAEEVWRSERWRQQTEAEGATLTDRYNQAELSRQSQLGLRAGDRMLNRYAQFGAGIGAIGSGSNQAFGYLSGLAGEQMGFALSRNRMGDARGAFGRMASLDRARFIGTQSRIGSLQGGIDELDAVRPDLQSRFGEAISSGNGREAQHISQQILALDQQRAQLARQIADSENEQARAKSRTLQLASQLTRAEITRAESARDSMGRVTSVDRQAGRSYYRSAMRDGSLNEQETLQLEDMGFGSSRDVIAARRRLNQGLIDSDPAGLRPEGAKTSEELKRLEKKLDQIEMERAAFASTFERNADRELAVLEKIAKAQDDTTKRIDQLESRLKVGSGGGN